MEVNKTIQRKPVKRQITNPEKAVSIIAAAVKEAIAVIATATGEAKQLVANDALRATDVVANNAANAAKVANVIVGGDHDLLIKLEERLVVVLTRVAELKTDLKADIKDIKEGTAVKIETNRINI